MGREKYLAERNTPLTDESRRRRSADLEPRVRDVIAKQDAQGRWIDDGKILCSIFIKNVQLLSDYIALARGMSDE